MNIINEFAIEPEVMGSWENFRLLFPDFGVEHGRLIARYPKDWAKEVEALVSRLAAEFKIQPIRAKTIVERIYADRHKFVPARRDYDRSKEWLQNAETVRPKFDAVVAGSNPRHAPGVLDITDLDKEDVRYKARTQSKVPRSANHLAQCAQLLLSVCEEIQLVDQNFDATKARFTETIRSILEVRADAPQQLRRFEIHTRKAKPFSADVQHAHFRRAFQSVLPTNTKLRVFFWDHAEQGERMHPRFLLTEFGGLQYDYGLDEGRHVGEKTVVATLEHALWIELRGDYAETGTAFEITPDAIVEISSTATARRAIGSRANR